MITSLEQDLLSVQSHPPIPANLSHEASIQLRLEDLREIENKYWQ